MNPTQQVLAEGLINKILMKGIFGELKRTTDISHDFVTSNSYLYNQSSNSSTLTSSTLPSPESDARQYYTTIGQSFE